ncbi:ATP-binding protein [Marinilactibacillus psychrotolerans]|uniref:ATP-binding protein n=1 Tax=Marinilactibacillus psychrotolerans TaxID=191770 RepID=UPI001C7CEE47|nr:ATP-binding protein [Marinilactibacillus psychrotolerans]GEQ33690.1 HerA helicase [Marinilactibacillus psychrotolerans]
MRLDEFYYNHHKAHYYLGLISSVGRKATNLQIENLSLLEPRLLGESNLLPNTIDFFVCIESSEGIFLGKVFRNSVKNSDVVHKALDKRLIEEILPDIQLEILALMPKWEDKFEMPGFKNVGIGDRVYIAPISLVNAYFESIQIEIDEEIIDSFAQVENNNLSIFKIGVNNLLNRHLMVIGATGSGKSTSSLRILEKLIDMGKKVIVIDPTGEYKSSFQSKGACQYTLGDDLAIAAEALSYQQWNILFETNDNTQPVALKNAIESLRYQEKSSNSDIYKKDGQSVIKVEKELNTLTITDKSFDINLLAKQVTEEAVEIKSKSYSKSDFKAGIYHYLVEKIEYKMNHTSLSRLFDTSKLSLIERLNQFLNDDSSIYIDSSKIGSTDGVGGMIVDLITNHLLECATEETKSFVFFLDEAHRYTRNSVTANNSFYTGLVNVAREGRKRGQYLLLTTQSPNDVSNILLSQMGGLLIHRLTHTDDLNAVINYLNEGSLERIKKLGKGQAILSSVNLLHDVNLRVIKSNLPHKNLSPKL